MDTKCMVANGVSKHHLVYVKSTLCTVMQGTDMNLVLSKLCLSLAICVLTLFCYYVITENAE